MKSLSRFLIDNAKWMYNLKITFRSSMHYHRNKLKGIIIALILPGLILLHTVHKTIPEDCPLIYGNVLQRVNYSSAAETIDCSSFLKQGQGSDLQQKDYRYCIPHSTLSEQDYLSLTLDCNHFRTSRGYNTFPVLEEEKNFPIAFSILMYENVQQVERLLRAIYRPHNFYCIHIDSKANVNILRAISAVAGCLQNVFLSSQRANVVWGRIGVLKAEITCIKDLLKYSTKWKYFINLTGREMPLKTNLELVRILKGYNGSNDIQGYFDKRNKEWNEYVWKDGTKTKEKKSSPPHGLKIAKGSAHIVSSREFAYFATGSQIALDLLDWLKDTFVPDEHFFGTLQHISHHGIPGTNKERFNQIIPSRVRVKWWNDGVVHCSGVWIRQVCNFGVGDLYRLVAVRPELFANKFNYAISPIAFDCMEQWYHNRSRMGVSELSPR